MMHRLSARRSSSVVALLADLANGENRARADTHRLPSRACEIQPGDDQVLGERTSLQVEAAIS